MKLLDGPHYCPKNEDIQSLVIFLHGFGADGDDLISLTPYFAQSLPNTAFHAPHGADICEISPFGRQWFSLAKSDPDYMRRNATTQEAAFELMYDEACDAAPIIEHYIDTCAENYGLTRANVTLVGFSQGTMMALHIGLRSQIKFQSLIGFSGALVGRSRLPKDIITKPDTLLIHGDHDEMLPVNAVKLAEVGLIDAGVKTTVFIRPNLPHSIDQEGVDEAIRHIKKAQR
jgi:phospholipase/carboxylesterase